MEQEILKLKVLRRLGGLTFLILASVLFSALFAFSETTTFTYDASNRLTSTTYGSSRIEYSYDAAGNRIQVVTPYTITITKSGLGSGTVTSFPEGIDFGTDNVGIYDFNDAVTLTATAASNSIFTGWLEDCIGAENPVIVTVDGIKNVTAVFDLLPTVTANANGDGTGTVASSLGGISYSFPTSSSETTTPLALGTTISLTATAGDDTKVFWADCTAIGGVVSGNGTTIATCTFSSLESSKIVSVTFSTAQYMVTATVGANGNLDYTTPSPVAVSPDDTASFKFNADAGYHVASVSGCSGTPYNNTSNLITNYIYNTGAITENCTVEAIFAVNRYTLSIERNGTGTGTVYSVPEINCGDDCSEIYDYGTSVTLTAEASEGSVFKGWSGGVCSGIETCQVIIYEDLTATAQFDLINPSITSQSATTGETTTALKAQVNPNGLQTNAWFEWESDSNFNPLSPSYGNSTLQHNLGSGAIEVGISEGLSGLTANTKYHFRCVARNLFATKTEGNDQTFTTTQTGDPVAIGEILYSNLQLACDAAVDQDKILISEGVISGPVTIDSSNITMFLEGGWSCDFSCRTGVISVVQGPFTIKNGSVSVDGIAIK